jgi:sugar O-acyltransferase (sialic acid O-acetyltransferase NeuD family)
MPKKLLIFPAGGNAREALFTIEAINKTKKTWDVLGFVDDDPSLLGKRIGPLKVLGDRGWFKKIPDAQILAVPGNPKDYLKRKAIIDGLKIEKSRFAKVIHPAAVVSSAAEIGYNTLIMAHAVVSCDVLISNHCIVLPQTTIAHDSRIGDYCCIGANVVLSGSVVIEPQCYIGSGVTIREKITVGRKSLVGLGANVVDDVKQNDTVAGNPARSLRKKDNDFNYFTGLQRTR